MYVGFFYIVLPGTKALFNVLNLFILSFFIGWFYWYLFKFTVPFFCSLHLAIKFTDWFITLYDAYFTQMHSRIFFFKETYFCLGIPLLFNYYISFNLIRPKFLAISVFIWLIDQLQDYQKYFHLLSMFVSEFFVCLFLVLHLWHMEFPRIGVKSELQLPAYTTATATPYLSCVCKLHHSSRQHRILNPLSEARDQTCNLVVPRWIHFRCAMRGTPRPKLY